MDSFNLYNGVRAANWSTIKTVEDLNDLGSYRAKELQNFEVSVYQQSQQNTSKSE